MACVRLYVHLYLTEGHLPPTNHRISKIPKPKCVSAHSEQLFFGGGPPLPVEAKFFDTGFGLIHVQTGKIFFFQKIFFLQNFFNAHFIELAELSVNQFSS